MEQKERAFDRIVNRVPESTKEKVNWQLDIAEKIANFLKKKKISEEEASSMIGIPKAQLIKWQTGLHSFNSQEIDKLSEFLGEQLPKK